MLANFPSTHTPVILVDVQFSTAQISVTDLCFISNSDLVLITNEGDCCTVTQLILSIFKKDYLLTNIFSNLFPSPISLKPYIKPCVYNI